MFSVLTRAARQLPVISLIGGLALLLTATRAQAAPVIAPDFVGIYTLTTFTGMPPGGATAPDDLAISADGKDLWVGYGNGVDTTGASGSSNAVEYDIGSGAMLLNVSVPGHMDGLKINPKTDDVWATENEDGNPTLAIINHKNGKFKIFKFEPTLITGGMDDLVFAGDKDKDVFIVTSSQMSTSMPVIVEISGNPKKKDTKLISTQVSNPLTVWNVVANEAEAGDMIGDPDSMTLDSAGELVLDNRDDVDASSLYIVRNPGATNPVLRVPLTYLGSSVQVNDTIFTNSETSGEASTAGTIFITATSANKIYMLSKPYFPSNEVYTASNTHGIVGLVDLNTGIITPVATGFSGLHGLAFAPTSVAIMPDKK